MKDFEGKTAVITGGASGIGLALAKNCSERGMNVVLADIQEDALGEAVTYFEERQRPVLGVHTNTMLKEAWADLHQQTTDRFGNVHLLFNNAGVVNGGAPVPVWELPQSDWDWVMGVNFYGVLYGLQTFVPAMLAHGESGHIVNTASIAAFIPGGGPYGVSKYGVIKMSEALAGDLKAANARIGASVLCPGWVNTKIGDAERNRPEDMSSSANPEGAGLGIEALMSNSKPPEDLAAQVLQAIEEENFYILPHRGWDHMLRSHTDAILDRNGPYVFNVQEQMERGLRGEDV